MNENVRDKKIDFNDIKYFLRKVLIIAFPIILEQLLVSSFGVIDTIMVKNIERGISGVGLASQISNICGIIMFAFATGVGMYIAQYFGDRDSENIKKSFSLLLTLGFILSSIFLLIGLLIPRAVLSLFTNDNDVLEIGVRYLRIACISYIPNQLSYAYVVVYRNIQKPLVSVIIQMSSAVLNVLFNWLLIFGIWIFPEMGITGAALATVISCSLSLCAHIIYAYVTKQMFCPSVRSFIECLKRHFCMRIIKRSIPLIINETLFSVGTLIYVAIFNRLGSDSYEGYRISETIMNVMFSFSYGANAATGAIVGACLGRCEFDEAKRYSKYFLVFGLVLSLFVSSLLIILSKPLVNIFNSDEVSENTLSIARIMMYSCAVRICLKMFANIILSIFRAGGKTKFVMVLDCLVMWVVGIPIAFIGYRVFGIDDIALLYLIMQLESLVRITVGLVEYFRFTWLNNIINTHKLISE